MADYYVDLNGKITTKKNNNKKKKFVDYVVDHSGILSATVPDDIAPVKKTTKGSGDSEKERTWFQKSELFDDGYQFGDVTKTIIGSTTDVRKNMGTGIVGMGETLLDAMLYVAPYIAQGQYYSNGGGYNIQANQAFDQSIAVAKKENATLIEKDLYDEEEIAKKIISDPVKNLTGIDSETDSVFGEKSDALAQSAGQLAATTALSAAGVPWYLTTGLTSFGGETENALKQGATMEEAGLSAAITAGAEILTEKISGGISFGGKTLDDALTKELARVISDKTVRTMAKLGMDAVGEGGEEVLSGVMSAIGQKLTYAEEQELQELFTSEDAWESFIGGAVLGGGSSAISAVKSNKEGVDSVTGFTDVEQKVVDKVYADSVAEAEKEGKISEKEKRKIYDTVLDHMEKGYISIDTIEEALGGETYNTYKSTVESEDALQNEFDTLNKMKQGEMTGEQIDRRAELKEQLKSIKETSKRNELKQKLSDEVFSMVKDSRLSESFAERSRRGQAFEADLTQYTDEKQRAIVQKAVESGILNNTRRTHEFVDWVSRVAAEKDLTFDFANNAKLKESGFAVDGRTVNGVKTNDGIVVNVQSAKALNSVVGHEITHVLESSPELYQAVQEIAIEYAKSKGDYQGRYDALVKLYEGVEGADINAELTADIVGDYLFTDSDFINTLSTKNRNILEKIYDEVKYLLKVATAGSKEARELEKLKHAVEKAYRESAKNNTAEDGGVVKHSLTSDGEGRQLSAVTRKEAQAEISKLSAEDRKVVTDARMRAEYARGIATMSDSRVKKAVDDYSYSRNPSKTNAYMAYIDPYDFLDLTTTSVQEFLDKNPERLNEGVSEQWGTPNNIQESGEIFLRVDEDGNVIGHEGRHRMAALYREGVERAAVIVQTGVTENAKPISIKRLAGQMNSGITSHSSTYLHNMIPLSKEYETIARYVFGGASKFNSLADPNIRYSLSSMANTFFGDENMSANEFMKRDYRETQGYKDYVEQSINNLRQTLADFDEAAARKEVEDAINGIVRVAIAAKQAGYDIQDDSAKRSKRDSKNRLLFSSLEPNSDYFTSNDISTICDKRKNFAEIYDDIVRAEEAKGVPEGKRFFDNVDNYFYLHKLMADKGLTQPCRQCYVESMRKNLAPMANAFLRLVRETDPDNLANDQLYHQRGKNKGGLKTNNASTREWVLSALAEYDMSVNSLSMETLTTAEGLAQLKIQAPMVYEAFNSFYGQSKPKMPKGATPFRFGELTALLTDEHGKIKKSVVDKINSTGGFRLQSYSDFQIQNFTDVLQVIYEAGTLGLSGHAYTKVPAFLEATEGTNLKRNISIFMYKDGNEWKLDRNDSFPYSLEEIYDIVNADKSGNTSIIAVSQNEDMSAWIMANDNVGYGIPFHKSGLKMGTVRDTIVKEDGREVRGYSGTKDHTRQQTEVWARSSEDHKALTKVKNGINIYRFWDFDNKSNLSKNELIEKNVKAYIDACWEMGYLPKFREYVMNNGKVLENVLAYAKELGSVPQDATIADISFEYRGYTIPYGYYKFLGDFGMFTPDGKASSHEVLSLNNYDFDKAVKFFEDSETLRRNEILQQFSNGEERNRYRNSNLTTEELAEIVKQKRKEIVDGIVDSEIAPTKNSLSALEEAPVTYGNYNVYGKDIALETAEDVAPVREDVTPVQETAADVAVYEEPAQAENPYAELDRLNAEMEELEQQMYEAMDAGEHEKAAEINADLVDAAIRYTKLEQQLDAEEQDRLSSFTDADAPAVGEAPYRGEPATSANPFADRDIVNVGKRKVKAYMYENPEVKPFFQQEALGLLGELSSTVKGEKWFDSKLYYDTGGEQGWGGTKRYTSDDIAYLLDEWHYTYDQIKKGLQAIINDEGAENNAVSKRIEFIIDERLRKGYTDFAYGIEYPPNQEYIDLLNEKHANEYADESFGVLMENADMHAPPVEEDVAPLVDSSPVVSDDIAPVAESDAPVVESTPVEEAGNKPIQTVKQRLEAKLRNFQTELENNQRLREESSNDYELEILQAQTAYNALKNKNTAKANNLLRRIERLRRISGNEDANFAKRISDLEAKVAQVSEELRSGESTTEQGAMRRELHANIVENIRNQYAVRGYDFDTVLENAKDLSTLATVDNTPQRVMEKALGYKEGQILADMTVNKVAENETEGIKWLNSYTNRQSGMLAQISKQYNIKPRSKESAAAQMYAEGFYVAENGDIIEYGDKELAKDFPDAKVQANIKGLASDPRIRQIYDETLEMINASRTRNAYPEIKKLDNYFLHFRAMDDTFSKLGIPFNPNDIRAKDLPTDLNGVTADLKPGQPYFASAMHRRGQRTSFDLLGGLEQYLTSAKDQIYHIDDIQTFRALRNFVADTYGQAKGLEGLDALTEEEAQAKLEQVYDGHLSTFAKFLNEEANVIAGKTALIDRGLEGIIGRRGMTFFDTLNRQVGANMVGFNVSSSLTNFIAPVQAFAKTNKAAFVKGFAQTVANRVASITGKSDGFAESNPTMIRRQGADRFSRTPWQKAADIGYSLMGAVDSISTEIIVRSKINEYVQKGMDADQAVIEADKWASRLMGDRSLGQQPQLYNSKMAGLVTKFQLEVRNQLDSQFYDTIQEAKVSNEDIENAKLRNAKTAAQVASTFVQLAVVQHLFGKAFEAVAGYNPAFDIIEAIIKAFGWDDEEDSEDTVLDNLGQGLMSIAEDMPYSSVLTGTGRIPIASALPIGQFIKGEDKYGNEKSRWETLAETAPYYLLPGGYGQIKKTTQGLGMFDEDLPIAGSYTNSGNLRFPVEDTLVNRAQAAVFGQYASSNAREYFDNERQSLKKNQIQELIDVDIPIRDYWEYRDGLKEQETLAEKFDYIAGLDLPIDKKNILINNVVDRKEAVDLSTYHLYDNYEEFDFATKNPEKYDFLQSVGVSVREYNRFDDDTKDAYNWAYENPEKYAVSKAIASDVAVYRQYTKALNDISADKDASGKTISNSRKMKVAKYINSLDVDYGEKIILFKSMYNSDDTYNREIVEYLNGRNDISYEEKVTILKELGFVVLPNGAVRW